MNCIGKSPVIIAHLTNQLDDMKRFCFTGTSSNLQSVIGIDSTFNLRGLCFITMLVYKNMVLVCKETNDHPVFVGNRSWASYISQTLVGSHWAAYCVIIVFLYCVLHALTESGFRNDIGAWQLHSLVKHQK